MYVDNYLDGGYHVPHLHKGLAPCWTTSSTLSKTKIVHSCSESMVASNEDAATGATRKGDRAWYFWQYPNLMINCYEGYMDTNYVIPVDADHCTVIFDFYFSDGGRSRLHTESVNVGNRVQDEDLASAKRCSGPEVPRLRRGRLSVRREAGEQLFHRLLAADLKGTPLRP